MTRTIENLSGTDALVRVLTAAEGHSLPVPELIERALQLQGWSKTAQGAWKHARLTGKTPDATLASRCYTTEPFVKIGRGIVRLRTPEDPPFEKKPRAMTLEAAQDAVEKATERLAQAKATLKEVEKAAREEVAALVAGEEGGSKA